MYGCSKNGTSPKRLQHKVSRFKKSDGAGISFVEEKDRNPFHLHQSTHGYIIRLFDEKLLPDCIRLYQGNDLSKMEPPRKLVKDTGINIGRFTIFNNT